jgi:hypothetical protein
MASERFAPFGRLVNVAVTRDRDGNSRGFGFVAFAEPSQAANARQALHGADIDGHKVSYLAYAHTFLCDFIQWIQSMDVSVLPCCRCRYLRASPSPMIVTAAAAAVAAATLVIRATCRHPAPRAAATMTTLVAATMLPLPPPTPLPH